jgi:hypothetical protein
MASSQKSYGDVTAAAQAQIRAARLRDPGEHFPYKRDAVEALLAEDPPMGPGITGGHEGVDDRSREVADYTSPGIAAATDDYITAQEAYLRSPSDDTKSEYDAARDRLQAARLDHRANRANTLTIGGAARRAG